MNSFPQFCEPVICRCHSHVPHLFRVLKGHSIIALSHVSSLMDKGRNPSILWFENQLHPLLAALTAGGEGGGSFNITCTQQRDSKSRDGIRLFTANQLDNAIYYLCGCAQKYRLYLKRLAGVPVNASISAEALERVQRVQQVCQRSIIRHAHLLGAATEQDACVQMQGVLYEWLNLCREIRSNLMHDLREVSLCAGANLLFAPLWHIKKARTTIVYINRHLGSEFKYIHTSPLSSLYLRQPPPPCFKRSVPDSEMRSLFVCAASVSATGRGPGMVTGSWIDATTIGTQCTRHAPPPAGAKPAGGCGSGGCLQPGAP